MNFAGDEGMLQLNLFSVSLEDQIADLKQGEELEFYRGKERLLIRKHEKYQGVFLYQGPDFSDSAFHLDEKGVFGGLDIFVVKIDRWCKAVNGMKHKINSAIKVIRYFSLRNYKLKSMQ